MKMEDTPDGRKLIAEENLTGEHAGLLVELMSKSIVEGAENLFLDLGAVEEMDGQGVMLLAGLALSCQAKEIPLHLEAVRPEVRRVLDWCRLPGLVSISGEDADGPAGE